ncbi:MAG: tRNA (adenosine(37)-N6)-threonylcarbamoyltransferase complex dimerization subunit type 1 TsaB [Planctomycetota bacterium]
MSTGATRLVVAIETSSRAPSIAALAGDGAIRHRDLEGERAHASDVLPALEELLREIGADRRDLARVVVGLGPGSLTGMRVGVAVALGLARAARADLVGVPSFEALASDVRGVALLVGDARGARFNVGAYEVGEEGARELAPLASLDEAGARSFLAEPRFAHAVVHADDSSIERFELGGREPRPLRPRADQVLRVGLGRTPAADLASVQPLYLRPFEARTRRR